MAAKLAISSPLTTTIALPNKFSSQALSYIPASPRTKTKHLRIHAQLGGEGGGEVKQKEKRKFITKDQEPEQYWQTAGEREGENPMSTPLPYIIIFGMSTPFIILAIAFLNGWIKVPIR